MTKAQKQPQKIKSKLTAVHNLVSVNDIRSALEALLKS